LRAIQYFKTQDLQTIKLDGRFGFFCQSLGEGFFAAVPLDNAHYQAESSGKKKEPRVGSGVESVGRELGEVEAIFDKKTGERHYQGVKAAGNDNAVERDIPEFTLGADVRPKLFLLFIYWAVL
jgi:hypothetical protein